MQINKLIVLIIGLLLIAFAASIAVSNYQNNKTISEYLDRENKLEYELTQSIKNFTELEEMYLELKQENMELKEANKEILGWREFICTAYSDNDGEQGTNNIVATNFNLDWENVKNLPIVASNCIPLYSIIEIKGLGGYIVLDRGLGYKTDYGWEDENWVDILFDSKEEALNFGIQEREIRIIK